MSDTMREDKTLKNLIRSNKGFTMQDLAIATLIITIFVGLISTLMYSVYKTNVKTNLTSQMATYAVQILEDIDKIPYEDVKPELADEYKSDFSIPESFNISIEVSNYGEGVNNVQDVIKIVKLNISYTILNETEGFSIQKLKIKEM